MVFPTLRNELHLTIAFFQNDADSHDKKVYVDVQERKPDDNHCANKNGNITRKYVFSTMTIFDQCLQYVTEMTRNITIGNYPELDISKPPQGYASMEDWKKPFGFKSNRKGFFFDVVLNLQVILIRPNHVWLRCLILY